MTAFVKMHGLGNDFMLIDARRHPATLTPQQVRNLADRRTGVGFDQLILLEPGKEGVRVRFWNSDGSEVAACGNGARAVAVWLGGQTRLETGSGPVLAVADGGTAEIDLGRPRHAWQDVPLAYAMDTAALPLGWGELERPAALSVGNPHVVFEVSDADAVPLARLAEVAGDPVFPDGVNVGVAEVLAPDRIRLRVWERGAGATPACGTGAAAAVAALCQRRRVGEDVQVMMPGGCLRVRIDGRGHLLLSGPAVVVFRGEIALEDFA